MAETTIYLSFPLRSDAPSPPAIPTIELSPFLTIAEDGANVTKITLTSHTGTHLDTPRHVIPDGLTLTDLEPADFIFDRPAVIDLPMGDAEVVPGVVAAEIVGVAEELGFTRAEANALKSQYREKLSVLQTKS